jgi:hypothetical protein
MIFLALIGSATLAFLFFWFFANLEATKKKRRDEELSHLPIEERSKRFNQQFARQWRDDISKR